MKTPQLLLAAAAAVLSSTTLHAQEWGVIATSTADVYTNASYTSSVDTQEHMGAVVKVMQKDGIWMNIDTGQSGGGWVSEKCIVFMPEDKIAEYRNRPKCICTCNYSEIRATADGNGKRISGLVLGDSLATLPCAPDSPWLKVALPDGREGWVRRADVTGTDVWRERNAGMTDEERIEAVIRVAEGMLGTPYVWGGMSSTGTDCSGLTKLSFKMAGIDIPRNASQQFPLGTSVKFKKDCSKGWNLSSLKRGDLVFFGKPGNGCSGPSVSHVGIYLGNGKFIQSSHYVRINSLLRTDADAYENAHKLVGVKRLIGQ